MTGELRDEDRPLLERDLDPDPFVQFGRWLSEAEAAGIHLANAVMLATATLDGRPSARNVLLRGFDRQGFVFYTNYESRKGRELSENPNAALVFYWADLHRQVCVTGNVDRTSREESERYFATRPREARLGAWASQQSRVIGSREELDERFREMATTYPGDDIPLPPFWGGYRLAPDMIEFWQGRLYRLHDRLRYSRRGSVWVVERLSP